MERLCARLTKNRIESSTAIINLLELVFSLLVNAYPVSTFYDPPTTNPVTPLWKAGAL